MNVALLSPSKDAYSETFIQAQKEFLPFRVFHYFDGFLPKQLEGRGSIIDTTRFSNLFYKMSRKLKKTPLHFFESSLAKSFLMNEIDVVLAQYGQTGEAVAEVCKQTKIPLIVHFHGFDASRYDVIENYNKYAKTFAGAKAIIAVSTAMENRLLELGCPREKLHYSVYGPNDSFLNIIPKFAKHHFIGVGRFTDKKAPYYTILAFSKVLKKFPEASLTIGGNGELFNTCMNLIKYLKIEHAVHLPGVIKPEDFRKYLEESVAFVQHSIIAENGDSEGTPVAILEASGAGLPVIATKHAGIPDVIVNNETGFLVNEHDVDGMANAMLKVLQDKEIVKKMGMAGKKHVRENYSMNHYITKLSKVIENSLA